MDNKSELYLLKDYIDKLNELKKYLLRKKVQIIILSTTFGILGLVVSIIYKPKYTATLSFAVQESEKMGGLSGLASQFGFSVGGSSSGIFGGDNLYEIIASQKMIIQTLLKQVEINKKKTTLLNYYIDVYNVREKWKKSDKENIRNLNFPIDQSKNTFSRTQDSVLLAIVRAISKKQLVISKRDKKLNIGDVEFISRSETLSKLFVENLMFETSSYYIQSNTRNTTNNYNSLKKQTDSIKNELERALVTKAQLSDNNMYSVRQSSNVPLLKKQIDLQVSIAAYTEMKKNLEVLKMSVIRQTPLIEIIDQPEYPLKKFYIPIPVGIILGLFFGALFSTLFYTIKYSIDKLKLNINSIK